MLNVICIIFQSLAASWLEQSLTAMQTGVDNEIKKDKNSNSDTRDTVCIHCLLLEYTILYHRKLSTHTLFYEKTHFNYYLVLQINLRETLGIDIADRLRSHFLSNMPTKSIAWFNDAGPNKTSAAAHESALAIGQNNSLQNGKVHFLSIIYQNHIIIYVCLEIPCIFLY